MRRPYSNSDVDSRIEGKSPCLPRACKPGEAINFCYSIFLAKRALKNDFVSSKDVLLNLGGAGSGRPSWPGQDAAPAGQDVMKCGACKHTQGRKARLRRTKRTTKGTIM